MSTHRTSPFVEPLGYQPVEFLDLPPMAETSAAPSPDAGRRRQRSGSPPRPPSHDDDRG